MAITAVTCVAALGVAFTRGDLEPKPRPAVVDQDGLDQARSDALEAPAGSEEPEAVAAAAPSTAPDRAREAVPRLPVVIVIGGIEGGEIRGGEVEVGDERIPLDPIAHTALPPGRYPLRWRHAPSTEWQDAGIVDVMPEDVQDGLLRVQVSPTEGARVERRP